MKSNYIQLAFLLTLLFSCNKEQGSSVDLYAGFKNPPADARPFVRWWWNGDKVTAQELDRELEVMQKAGLGGVEINPIAFPEEATPTNVESLTWLSEEWNQLLVETGLNIKKRGMIADMIVGSGWPFGGEFLTKDQILQRITTSKLVIKGPKTIQGDVQQFIESQSQSTPGRQDPSALARELVFARLIPEEATGMDEITDLLSGNEALQLPKGSFELLYGYKETGHRNVMHGAPGAKGPVMDHYDKEVVIQYLERLKKIEKDTGIPLKNILRALFCDSIELAGANWTDHFDSLFQAKYEYPLAPFYPFIFYSSFQGYEENNYAPDFKDQIRRVRFDYNSLLVETFVENFIKTFNTFCHENGLLSRYQAYGTPFLMGMVEGNMIADIPESNNWIFSAPLDTPKWLWNQGHGYMIWNLYAASGGHLTGKKIISSEAMTNTKGVFQLTLEDIKQADDMNFITGINHSVLHGYNYSPPDAGFPGWIRYGAYFSDQNTWWPYFKYWADYNARLNFVFQNSQPIKKIAILGPQTDLWADVGLARGPFHMTPWYLYKLWEPVSQIGSSCEYINERIIRDANKESGTLRFGPMEYEALMIVDVKSMQAETVNALLSYVEKGGKLIFVETRPERSASMTDIEGGDELVQDLIARMLTDHSDQVMFFDPPEDPATLLEWTTALWNKANLPYDVKISKPDDDVYQLHQTAGDREIFFFTNTHRKWSSSFRAQFDTGEKTAWIWDPETGDKAIFPTKTKRQLDISLNPLESVLLVFSEETGELDDDTTVPGITTPMSLTSDWEVTFEPAFGAEFTANMTLKDFTKDGRPQIKNFAGQAVYRKEFTPESTFYYLTLGKVNRGVTEVTLNGHHLGVRWYGQHRYDVTEYLKIGEPNQLEIRLTTTLANYARSLKDNKVTDKWLRGFVAKSEGLEGPVVLQ